MVPFVVKIPNMLFYAYETAVVHSRIRPDNASGKGWGSMRFPVPWPDFLAGHYGAIHWTPPVWKFSTF